MSNPSKQTVKGYELVKLLGEGAFGAVYQAHQPVVEREVAVKIILPEYASRPDFIRRFESEAQLVAQLEHLHIVPLYDYWRDPQGAYLVMRLMKGGSLEGLIQKGALPLVLVARILEQVASALAAAHRRGIVHRDIKPANILLDEEGNAYLSDFGIAKALGEESGLTVTGAIVGTPAYITPEQAQSLPVSPQTDIYALGVVLYVMLAGEHPFPEASPGELIARHLRDRLPPVHEIKPDLTAEMDAVVQRATAKNPAERYPDVIDMLADLREALGPELAPLPVRPLTEELLEVSNPFKGLRPFQEADADDFYGREALIKRLLARLAETGEYNHFLAVVGPSGSGKSSVVKAGLIPALRAGALAGSHKWYITEMVPGNHPLEELELALLRIAVNQPPSLLGQLKEDGRGLLRATRRILPDEAELLLVVDQFEEIFTQAVDKSEAGHFMNLIYQAVGEPDSPVRVAITLRADFYDRPLMEPDFSALVQERTEVVVPLTSEELEEAIRCPVEGVGAALGEGLAQTIVGEVIEQPGALPLLQYALMELFERRDGRTLTHEAYRSIGGVLGALGRRAEEVYRELDLSGQTLSRQVFLRLVSLGEGVEDTRRRVLRSELTAIEVKTANPGEDRISVDQVIESFGEARLLSFDHDPQTRAPTVEVAHEALLREWKRLKGWLEESRADIRMQRLLGAAAQDWEATNQDASFLLRGSRLAQFESWAEETTLALTDQEKLFLQSSIEDEIKRIDLRAALERRSRNFLRALVGVLVVAAVIAIVLSVYAFNQQGIAQDSAATATVAQGQAQYEAATAVAAQEDAHIRAIAEAQAREEAEKSQRLSTSNELVSFARSELEKLSDASHSLSLLLARQAALTTLWADGYVTAQAEATLRQAINSAPVLVKTLSSDDDFLYWAFWSPDSKKIITVGNRTRVWDADSGEELWVMHDRCGRILVANWSPDGKMIVSTSEGGCLSTWDALSGDEELILYNYNDLKTPDWSPDGTKIAVPIDGYIIVVDAKTGEELLQKPMQSYRSGVFFSPDGDRILTIEGEQWIIIDSLTGEEELPLEVYLSSTVDIRWSRDGKRLLSSNNLGSVIIWDSQTGEVLREFRHTTGVESADWCPDENQIVAYTIDGIIHIWDIQTENMVSQWHANDEPYHVECNPGGTYILTASLDGLAHIWKIGTQNSFRHDSPVTSASWSVDGRRLLTTAGAKAYIWDVDQEVELLRFEGHRNQVTAAAWEPNGERVITGDRNGKAIIWDASDGEVLQRLGGNMAAHGDAINSITWDAHNNLIFTYGEDNIARIWDAESGEEIQSFAEDRSGALSPDGAKIITPRADGTTQISDAETGDILLELQGHTKSVNDADWSPDGIYVITASSDGTALIWNAKTGKEVSQLIGHTGSLVSVEWHPSGRQIVTASADGTARVWDAQTGEEVGRLLGHESVVIAVAWSPDGTQVLTASMDQTVRIWSIGIESLLKQAEELITRQPPEFTLEERCFYLHECDE